MTWQYISGFFDADGYITFSYPGNQKYKTVIFGFTNAQRSILEEIQRFILDETGEKGFIVKKSKRKENHVDTYDLKYSNTPKIKILKHIKSRHPMKVHRIQLVISELKLLTPRNGRYSDELFEKRKKFEENSLHIRKFETKKATPITQSGFKCGDGGTGHFLFKWLIVSPFLSMLLSIVYCLLSIV